MLLSLVCLINPTFLVNPNLVTLATHHGLTPPSPHDRVMARSARHVQKA